MAVAKVARARKVRAREVTELLKLAWLRDEELWQKSKTDARVLPDGRVLLVWGGGESGTLYPSREALESVLREGEEEAAKPPLDDRTLLPPIDDFLRDVEAHAQSLGARLRIPDTVLDRSEASLDAVDIALKRVRMAKRMTPEILTPLVAYVGEVLRRGCDGRWTKYPRTQRKSVPVFDPVDYAAWQERQRATWAAADQAAAEVRARGGSEAAAGKARHKVMFATYDMPTAIRYDVVEEPIVGHENEPAILARDGRLLQPFALVFIPMVEPSKRLPLRAAVDVTLLPFRGKASS